MSTRNNQGSVPATAPTSATENRQAVRRGTPRRIRVAARTQAVSNPNGTKAIETKTVVVSSALMARGGVMS
ncbi:hypothetical protein [Glycomyces algeriensis]|uniref:hypothetical protein n=1 Tax=Glycomyces algeriensis TaxID=256037 RepID=UPI003CD070BA